MSLLLIENSVPSPTDDPGGPSDGRGAEVKARPGLDRRSVSDRRHWLHHESVFLVVHDETTTTGPDLTQIVTRPDIDHILDHLIPVCFW